MICGFHPRSKLRGIRIKIKIGEDAIYIFLDTRAGYGYQNPPLDFGADFCIEIRGQNGKIRSSRYLSFTGKNSQEWRWIHIKNVNAAVGSKEIEITVDAVPQNIYFYIVSWDGQDEDYSGELINEDLSQVGETRAPPKNWPTTDKRWNILELSPDRLRHHRPC